MNIIQRTADTCTIRILFVVMIILPLFFQLPFNLYDDSNTLIIASGVLTRLPIPFSVPACLMGIALYGGFRRTALPSWVLVVTSCFLMIFTSIIVSEGAVAIEKWKLLFLQYLLPMSAFIFGYIFERSQQESTIAERGILITVGLIVPSQLLSTWMYRSSFFPPFSHYQNILEYFQPLSAALHENVFFFTIYQHLQYVPCILIGAYFFSLYSLWDRGKVRYYLIALTPVIGVYAVASTSKLALGWYLIGVIGFVIYYCRKNHLILPILLMVISLLLPVGYFSLGTKTDKGDNILNKKYSFLLPKNTIHEMNDSSGDPELEIAVPVQINKTEKLEGSEWISGRLRYWRFYINRITESRLSLFFGNPGQPDISKIPSAHNYYIDFVYNFGLLAILPLLFAVSATIILIVANIGTIYKSPSLLGLTFTVLFLMFVDNSLKVGMRQMYPGIVTFFLWGLLLNRLITIANIRKYSIK